MSGRMQFEGFKGDSPKEIHARYALYLLIKSSMLGFDVNPDRADELSRATALSTSKTRIYSTLNLFGYRWQQRGAKWIEPR